jgi:hypothetical protein
MQKVTVVTDVELRPLVEVKDAEGFTFWIDRKRVKTVRGQSFLLPSQKPRKPKTARQFIQEENNA